MGAPSPVYEENYQQPCRNCLLAPIPYNDPRPVFCDLGYQPLSNEYLTEAQLHKPETFYPLVPTVCQRCGLIQLPALASREGIFEEYAYFSSQSIQWVNHVNEYARDMTDRYGLNKNSRVLELASNDGAMLDAFRSLGIPALGIEPAKNVARVAQTRGLATIDQFFGHDFARELVTTYGYRADLVAANNVMAHVPDLDDFLTGVNRVLAKDGVFTVEFPDADLLVRDNQFDQVYHEHFSYFTEKSARNALARRGLDVFNVERLDTHGGSLRLYARRSATEPRSSLSPGPQGVWGASDVSPDITPYTAYADKPAVYRRAFLNRINYWRSEGLRVVGYGAPAKGNTMLNYCGIGPADIEYVVDSTPAKQGKFLPGSRIPIYPPERLDGDNPDVIVILPWNWTKEIAAKLDGHRARGTTIISRLEKV